MSKEMRNMINNFNKLLIEAEEKFLITENIGGVIKSYIQKTEYDILNSWGNCTFYTKDFIKKMGGKIVYMPLANPPSEDPEDHIVPVVGNTIIDFAYVPEKGVSKHDRANVSVPEFNPGSGENNWPRLTEISDQIFEEGGVYGKLGYLKDSKYADWEYSDHPELKKGKYPIYLKSLPSYAKIEKPNTKKP